MSNVKSVKIAHSGEERGDERGEGIASRLNWLRAGVLGANDGIVSVAATVVGVAGATESNSVILAAGVAAVIGGAISMALGEYVSVSSQRDSQRAMIDKERLQIAEDPDAELRELASIYESKGLSPETATTVATELTEHNALEAHLEAELHIAEGDVVSPWHAAFASAAAFLLGALLPMIAIMLPSAGARIPVTFTAVLVALALTGATSALIGRSSVSKAVARVVIGGALALIVTYGVGSLLGSTGVV
jgi:VIT1/CCC1 family predicted Fe2+/Mn2+ transporter